MSTVPILGFDIGQTTGYGLITVDGDKLTYQGSGLIKGSSHGLGVHLRNGALENLQLMDNNVPKRCCVAYEAPVMNKRAKSAAYTIGGRDILQHYCQELGVPFYAITAVQAKNAVTDNVCAHKPQVRDAVEKILGVKFTNKPGPWIPLGPNPDYHVSDALAVAIAMARRMDKLRRKDTRGKRRHNNDLAPSSK